MADLMRELPESVLVLIAFIAVTVFNKIFDSKSKSLTENTYAIIKLTTQFELFTKSQDEMKGDVKKLKEDVTSFHIFKRDLINGKRGSHGSNP